MISSDVICMLPACRATGVCLQTGRLVLGPAFLTRNLFVGLHFTFCYHGRHKQVRGRQGPYLFRLVQRTTKENHTRGGMPKFEEQPCVKGRDLHAGGWCFIPLTVLLRTSAQAPRSNIGCVAFPLGPNVHQRAPPCAEIACLALGIGRGLQREEAQVGRGLVRWSSYLGTSYGGCQTRGTFGLP